MHSTHAPRRSVLRHIIGASAVIGAAALSLSAVIALPASAASKANVKLALAKPASGTIAETGSTLLYPLFNLWVPGYNAKYKGLTIETAGTGSGTGITDATNGTVEIGASDAYLPSSDKATAPTLKNIPLAISAQEIFYNLPGVTTHLKLSGKVIAGMYEGKITTWNTSAIAALNPGVTLPSTPVVTLHRSESSGDTFLFTTYLSDTTTTWATKVGLNTSVTWPAAPGALGEQGNAGMVTGCKATPGCIAYVGISYQQSALGSGLVYAQLENGKGQFELPTPTTIKAEAAGFTKKTPATGALSMIDGKVKGGYPIINYEYAIVNDKQASSSTAKSVRSFLDWAINPKFGNASSYLSQVNFQPLPLSVVKQSYVQIQKIK